MGFEDANILKSPPFCEELVRHTLLCFPLDDLTLINGSSVSLIVVPLLYLCITTASCLHLTPLHPCFLQTYHLFPANCGSLL